MSERLNTFQKQLLDRLQIGLPISEKPFEQIAKELQSTAQEAIKQTEWLKNNGYIRRLRGSINYRALGRTATLCTVKVSENLIPDVASAVNELEGVSHNYLRDHEYNLWFTLQSRSFEEITNILDELSARFDLLFRQLPAVKMFKLDVRFNASGQSGNEMANLPTQFEKPIQLNEEEKQMITFLQKELEIIPRPFEQAGEFAIIQKLVQKGVIRKIAAVADHRKLGIEGNGMFCAKISEDRAELIGKELAQDPQISHCYLRKTFPGWEFNFFAMMHVRTEKLLQARAAEIIQSMPVENYALLRTVRELKKEPVKIQF